jgi:hypothetical protein
MIGDDEAVGADDRAATRGLVFHFAAAGEVDGDDRDTHEARVDRLRG